MQAAQKTRRADSGGRVMPGHVEVQVPSPIRAGLSAPPGTRQVRLWPQGNRLGQGWIAGTDGRHIPIRTDWGVRWNAGEEHTSGTETGFIALAVEGAPLGLFEPEMPAG